MFTSHHFQRHYQNCRQHINTAIGTAHKTCLRGFGGNGSIAWTSTVSHVGRTSNAFNVTMKLQTFLFQTVVISCIYVQYLWKYGFAKSSDNLYAPGIFGGSWRVTRPESDKFQYNIISLFYLTNIGCDFLSPRPSYQCSALGRPGRNGKKWRMIIVRQNNEPWTSELKLQEKDSQKCRKH